MAATAASLSTSRWERILGRLLSLAAGHPALGRVGRLVLTNCDSYDQFPPEALKKATALSRTLPRLHMRSTDSTGRFC